MMGMQCDILNKIIFGLVCTPHIIEQWISGAPIVLDTPHINTKIEEHVAI